MESPLFEPKNHQVRYARTGKSSLIMTAFHCKSHWPTESCKDQQTCVRIKVPFIEVVVTANHEDARVAGLCRHCRRTVKWAISAREQPMFIPRPIRATRRAKLVHLVIGTE